MDSFDLAGQQPATPTPSTAAPTTPGAAVDSFDSVSPPVHAGADSFDATQTKTDTLTPYARQEQFKNHNESGPFDERSMAPDVYADNRFDQQYGAPAIQSLRPQIAAYAKQKYGIDVTGTTNIAPSLAGEYVKSTIPPEELAARKQQYLKEYPIVKMIQDRDQYANGILQAFKMQNPGIHLGDPTNDQKAYDFIHKQLMGIGIDNEKMPAFTVTPDGVKTDVGRIHGFVDAFLRGSGNLAYKGAEFAEELSKTASDQIHGNQAGAEVNPSAFDTMLAKTTETGERYNKLLPQSTAAQNGNLSAKITEGAGEAAPMIIAAGAIGRTANVSGLFGAEAGGTSTAVAHAINFATMASQEGAGSYAEIYQSAIKAGQTKEQASLSAGVGGTLVGAINAYLMKFGTVGNMEKNAASNYLLHVGGNMGAQGGVGGAQDFVRQLANAIATGEPIDLKRLGSATGEGALTGGLISAVAPGKAPLKPTAPGEVAAKPMQGVQPATEATPTDTGIQPPPPENKPPETPATPPAGPNNQPPAQPAPTAKPEESTFTFQQRKTLSDWGYSGEDIQNMSPEQKRDALDAINAGTPKPATPEATPAPEANPLTFQQRKAMGELGYSGDEINQMTPEKRQEVLSAIDIGNKEVNNALAKATAPEAGKLPRDLSGAKPRYGYGNKQFDLEFASDTDKALYITAQATPSKRDAEYRQFLKDQGMSDADIASRGQETRAAIKDLAKNSTGDILKIPDRSATPAPKVEAPPTPAPKPAKKTWTPEHIDDALPTDLTDKSQREWMIDAMSRFTRKEDGKLDLHKMADEINKGKFPPPPEAGKESVNEVPKPVQPAAAPDQPVAGRSAEVKTEPTPAEKPVAPETPATRKFGDAGPVKLADLRLDPKRFQYKADTSADTGESDLLKGVKKFDKQKGGTILYWNDPADGGNYVINGHHRFGLAKRSGESEINAIRIDAKDASEARSIGALANIAEGRGTAIDAAKVFRSSGMDKAALEKEGVSLTEGKARDGLALSKLNPRLFDALVHGDIAEGRAIAIADSVESHAAQDSLYEMLRREEKRGRTITNAEIREVARFVNSSSDVTQNESTLFGDETTVKNLAIEKARVSAWIKKQMGRDQKLFSTVSRSQNMERLKEAGNVIDSEGSKKIASDAEMATFIYDKKSTAKGPVSDILNKAAEELAKGVPFEQATQGVYQAVRSELSRAEADAFGQGAGGKGPETTTGGKGEQAGFNFLPEKVSKEERSDTNEKVRTILFKLRRDNKINAQIAEPTGEQATVAARLRKFGVKLVMLDSAAKFGGFVHGDAPDILFMNSRRQGDLFKEAIGHELVHNIAKTSPDLFDALLRAADPKALDAASKKYLANIVAADKATGNFSAEVTRLASDPTALREEGIATLVQNLATDPKVWERIIGEGKPEQLSVFQKLAKVVKDFFGIGAKGGDDFASTVLKTLDAFERRNNIEPAGEGTSFSVDKTPSDDEILSAIRAVKGSTKLNRPDLSQRGVTPEARQTYNAVDALRNKAGEPGHQTDAEVNRDALELVKDPKFTENVLAHVDSGGMLTAAETAAVRIIADTQQPKNLASGDDAAAAKIGRLILADRTQASEMARSFRQRKDPLMSPAQRLQRTIIEALSVPDTAFKPPEKPAAGEGTGTGSGNGTGTGEGKGEAPEAPPVLDEKKAAAEIKKVRERLTGMGYDLSQIKNMSADRAAQMVRQIKAIRASKADALYEYWINSIMSGPGTAIANATSNAANAVYEFGMVRPLEMALNLVKGSPDAASFHEAIPMMKGIGTGLAQGFRNFIRSFREERPAFDMAVAGEAHQYDLLNTGGKGAISEAPSVFGADLSKIGIKGSRVRWATRLALAADQFQKTVNGYIQIGAEASRAGRKQGLTGDALSKFIADQTNNLNSPSWQAAYKIANRMTFNQKPDAFTKAVITARNIVPGGRWVLPFVNTMSNIVKAAVAASPLDTPRLGYKLARDAVDAARGKEVTYDRGDINQHIAKQIIAWGAASAIWQGIGGDDEWITGSKAAFEKRAIREEQYRAAPAQSIKIGGRWYSYAKVEPFATALSAMVDGIHELKNVKHGKDAGDAFGDFLTKAMGQFKDKTFMKGIGDIIQATEGAGKVENWGTNFAVSFVPNIIRQPLTMADPENRETRKLGEGDEATTFAQRLGRKALPGIIATPSPKVNLWGENAKKGEDETMAGTDILLRVMGLGGQLADNEKMDRLILNWNNQHPNDEYHPMTPDARVKIRNVDHTMNDEEYHLFLQASGRFAARKLERMNLDAVAPQNRDIKTIADSLAAARETVRARMMVAMALKQRGDTAGYDRAIKGLEQLSERMKP